MVQPHSGSDGEQVVDTMIGLTRLTSLHRAIVAGSDSMEFYLALRRRGFTRVATTTTCRIPKGQHAVGLITGVSLKIRARLEQMGFRIEAGVRCREGFVLSAVRQDFGQMQNAA
jgi:hypothetical protein